jgi:hypothetical protein
VQKHLRRGVIDLVRVKRFHHADVVRHRAEIWQQLRKLQSALPVALEFELRAREFQISADEGEALALGQFLRAFLSIHLLQQRLVVEQIELRRRADHVQVDDVLRLRRKMRARGGQRRRRRQIPRQQ